MTGFEVIQTTLVVCMRGRPGDAAGHPRALDTLDIGDRDR